MSIFNELLPKINEISNAFTKTFHDDLKAALECFEKFEEELMNGRGKARDKTQKDKNVAALQSINEDDDEQGKASDTESIKSQNKSSDKSRSSTGSNGTQRSSMKRSKNEVDGVFSPEQDKRQKRNASVKAQSIISKQVNVNLTQKMRREDDKKSSSSSTSSRRRNQDDKENTEPLLNIEIKQEKISLPPEPEPMDTENLPLNIDIKQELNKDEIAMPPPVAPVPKPRGKAVPKEKVVDDAEEETSGRRRTKKQTDVVPPVPSARSTRASSRSTKVLDAEESMLPPPPEPRPKRTRNKKKVSEAPPEEEPLQTTNVASPADKSKPKRSRRGQKAADKAEKKAEEPTPVKEERDLSPIISQPKKRTDNIDIVSVTIESTLDCVDAMDKTVLVGRTDMDKTVVLPNGVYNHAPVTPKNVGKTNAIMNETVVLDKEPKSQNMTDDNSILTEDNDSLSHTPPPKHDAPVTQPTSAVKEKVQQFEELATRVTRTKTRAMAKKEETKDTHTPPDKIIKPVLSIETLNKMNSMIFNGKQISSSATKPSYIPTAAVKTAPASTSKVNSLNKAREEAEAKKEKEDARRKKEALLASKRDLHKRKREEKMAAAAAAREAAERERRAAMQAAARERVEKQAHADQGKLERLKEAERKKHELARKAAEAEERRRVEEQARLQRLAEEQRRAEEARRKQLEEAAAMKKEAAMMAKEIERKQKEYVEKQKQKQRLEERTQSPHRMAALEPTYMSDGFQYLNSDEDEDPVDMPVPDWSMSKARNKQMLEQCRVSEQVVDRLFSVQLQSPDLRLIFPNIDRARLKRTSSAVWRTPPGTSKLATLAE